MQKVVPAILTNDPAVLKEQLRLLKDQSKWVQIDIMDGKFVPSISVSLSELGSAFEFFNLEIHLMVQDPENYLEDCSAAGAKRVYFHYEGTKNPERVLEDMKKHSFQRGVALNPETSVEGLAPFADKLDALLLLSVVPGEQGHEFIPSVAEKIPSVRALSPKILVGMDGGIGENNVKEIFQKGVNYVAVGSSIWKAEDPVAALRDLEEMVS